MHTLGIGRTDIGRARKQNEDAFHVDNDLGLFIVSDGMGGHAAGDVAAAMAVESVVGHVEEHRTAIEGARRGNGTAVEKLLARALESASHEVYQRATSDQDLAGMGCTLTAVVVGAGRAYVGHVGDTRLYLVRGEAVHQLSSDHTIAGELARSGALTPEQAASHPYAHVLSRAIGTQDTVQVDTLALDILSGDRLLLCSDGLTGYAIDMAWLAGIVGSEDFDEIPDALVDYANEQGGRDNITAVVVRVEADEPDVEATVSLADDVEVKLDALSSVFLFEGLSLAQLSRVLNAARLVELAQGQAMAREGEMNDALYVVVEGRVELSRGGKVLGELLAGDHVGAATVLRGRRALATAKAAEPSRMLRIDSEPFLALVRRRPWLGVALLERLGRRLGRDLDRALAGGARLDDGPPSVASSLL